MIGSNFVLLENSPSSEGDSARPFLLVNESVRRGFPNGTRGFFTATHSKRQCTHWYGTKPRSVGAYLIDAPSSPLQTSLVFD